MSFFSRNLPASYCNGRGASHGGLGRRIRAAVSEDFPTQVEGTPSTKRARRHAHPAFLAHAARSSCIASRLALAGALLLGRGDDDLGKEVGVLLVQVRHEGRRRPQVRGQEAVGLAEREEYRLDEVAHGTRVAARAGVAVLQPGQRQDALGGRRGHQARTTGRGDEPHADGAALAGHGRGHGVRVPELPPPVPTAHGDERQLGVADGSADGGGHLLGALDSKPHVAIFVAHGHEGLEPRPLARSGLLLHGHDLHDLVLELGAQEVVHDGRLLDGHAEQVDLLQRRDLVVRHQAAQLGARHPGIIIPITPTPTTAPTPTSTPAPAPAPTSAASSEASSLGHAASDLVDVARRHQTLLRRSPGSKRGKDQRVPVAKLTT
eukprot:scaffold1282_cov251-Pinguiococcus_pyrenoidosus.AAC.83